MVDNECLKLLDSTVCSLVFGIGYLGHHSDDRSGCVFFGVYMSRKNTEVWQVEVTLIWVPTKGER